MTSPLGQHNSMTPATVTVIIPSFNAQSTLASTLESLTQQTYPEWVALIIDDGSTDESLQIARRIAKTDPRFTVIEQSNQGVSDARNHGCSLVTTPYIAFLDADDSWSTSKLEKHVQLHDENPHCNFSFSGVEFYSADGQPEGIVSQAPSSASFECLELLGGNPTWTTSNWFLSQSLFERVGPFRAGMGYSEDLQWLIRAAAEADFSAGYVDDVLVGYRRSARGQSSQLSRMYRGWKQSRQEAQKLNPEVSSRAFKESEAKQCMYLAGRAWHDKRLMRVIQYSLMACSINPGSVVQKIKNRTPASKGTERP